MVLRATFVILCIVLSLALFSNGEEYGWIWAATVGVVVAGIVLGIEYMLRQAKPGVLLGGAAGLACGLLLTGLAAWALGATVQDFESIPVLGFLLLAAFPYLSLIYGVKIFTAMGILGQPGAVETTGTASTSNKILDTSVIIDGRIADVCDAGFIDGTLIIPQFVLHELQLVADSSDPLKRNRGRRGLDILQRVQKMGIVQVQIVGDDFPSLREVDLKLIELAKKYEAKIVTNDFNLNKVAQLQGLPVLNINELANALKPVVLPGEAMRVFILKEGKEYNQGVAYLDDGTMVVVDNAKKMISKTIDIAVTSVLQTTAGKMIFGRYEERRPVEAVHQ